MTTTQRIMDSKGGFVETTTSNQNSVSLKMNKAGEVTWDMKVYEDNPDSMKAKLKAYMDVINEVID